MKERIVIEKNNEIFVMSSVGITISPTEFEHTIEQVPETFEELKELCVKKFRLVFSKNINMEKDNEYIVCCWLNFYEYGDILDSDGYAIAVNRTPQQMWNSIKSLIGEE